MRRRYPQEDPSRREFFRHAACAAVGATAFVSTVWDLRYINAAVADKIKTINPAAVDYKALVCLFLYGGKDGNKMVLPPRQTNHHKYTAPPRPLPLPPAAPPTPTLNPPPSPGPHYEFL